MTIINYWVPELTHCYKRHLLTTIFEDIQPCKIPLIDNKPCIFSSQQRCTKIVQVVRLFNEIGPPNGSLPIRQWYTTKKRYSEVQQKIIDYLATCYRPQTRDEIATATGIYPNQIPSTISVINKMQHIILSERKTTKGYGSPIAFYSLLK